MVKEEHKTTKEQQYLSSVYNDVVVDLIEKKNPYDSVIIIICSC